MLEEQEFLPSQKGTSLGHFVLVTKLSLDTVGDGLSKEDFTGVQLGRKKKRLSF